MNNSISFKQLLDRLREKGCRKFIFDLSECDGFDSTFMGILLGLALGGGEVVLVNAKPPQLRVLTEVGMHRVVHVCRGPVETPDIVLERFEQRPVDQEVRLRLILEAHENLTRLDHKNEEKFDSFLRAVRGELRKGSVV